MAGDAISRGMLRSRRGVSRGASRISRRGCCSRPGMLGGGRRSSRIGCGAAGVGGPGARSTGIGGDASRWGMTGAALSLGELRSIPCISRLSGRFSRAGLGGMLADGCTIGADCGAMEGASRRGLGGSGRTSGAGAMDSTGRTSGAAVWFAGGGGNVACGWRRSLSGRPFSRRISDGMSAVGGSTRRISFRRSLFAAGTGWRSSGGLGIFVAGARRGAGRSLESGREGLSLSRCGRPFEISRRSA